MKPMEILPTSPAKHLARFRKLKNPKTIMDRLSMIVGDRKGFNSMSPEAEDVRIETGKRNESA